MYVENTKIHLVDLHVATCNRTSGRAVCQWATEASCIYGTEAEQFAADRITQTCTEPQKNEVRSVERIYLRQRCIAASTGA